MTGKLIYLAAPYTHADRAIMVDRFNRINAVAAKIMARGEYVFSPISHTHPIADAGTLPRGWEYWKGYDTVMVSRCTKLYVLMLEGWTVSVGVNAEIDLADKLNIPIVYIDEKLNETMDVVEAMRRFESRKT